MEHVCNKEIKLMFLTISAGSESHEGKPSNDSGRAQRDGRKRTGVKGIKEADVK